MAKIALVAVVVVLDGLEERVQVQRVVGRVGLAEEALDVPQRHRVDRTDGRQLVEAEAVVPVGIQGHEQTTGDASDAAVEGGGVGEHAGLHGFGELGL